MGFYGGLLEVLKGELRSGETLVGFREYTHRGVRC